VTCQHRLHPYHRADLRSLRPRASDALAASSLRLPPERPEAGWPSPRGLHQRKSQPGPAEPPRAARGFSPALPVSGSVPHRSGKLHSLPELFGPAQFPKNRAGSPHIHRLPAGFDRRQRARRDRAGGCPRSGDTTDRSNLPAARARSRDLDRESRAPPPILGATLEIG
jgi:hypothetical protein